MSTIINQEIPDGLENSDGGEQLQIPNELPVLPLRRTNFALAIALPWVLSVVERLCPIATTSTLLESSNRALVHRASCTCRPLSRARLKALSVACGGRACDQRSLRDSCARARGYRQG